MRFLPATVGALLLIAGAQPLAAQTTSKLRGDVNGDGQITSVDALAILSYTVGKSLPAEYTPLPNGDNNGDGQVTALDALIALSFIVGKDVAQFPINKPLQTTAMVEISPATAVVLVGQDAQLAATPRDSTGATMDAAVTWKSSDEAIVTVDANGKVSAKSLGVAIITATADGKSSSITVAGDAIADGTVAVTDYHACALTTTGSAICWGRNTTGELGDGTKVNRSTPVTVSGGQKWKAVAVAPGFSCGLTTAGAAYCWGYNSSAGLGDGTSDVERLTPAAVSGGRVYQAIAALQGRIAAVTDAGALYGWGNSVGDGTTTTRLVPTALTVPAGVTFKSVSAGDNHMVALTTTGAAYAWGLNTYGQLGDGTTTNRNAPAAVSGDLTFRSVTAGAVNTVAVTADGKAYWWGAAWSSADNRTTPTAVPGSLTFRSVHSGSSLLIGLGSTGTIYTWDGGTDAPSRSSIDRVFRTLAAHGKLTVGAAFDGSLWSWGYNDLGQLGDGSATPYRDEPGLVGGTVPTSRVTVTPSGVALMYKGGTATMTVTLTRVGGFSGDIDLSFDPLPGITGSFEPARLAGAATTSTLTITSSPGAPTGTYIAQIRVRSAGQLDQFSSAGVAVSGSAIGEGMVSAGGNTCGLTVAGKAYCVDAATGPTEKPVFLFQPVPGDRTFMTISTGATHQCALTPEGAAYCWGLNSGDLGVGSTEPVVRTPAPVIGGLTFRSISAGDNQTCALTAAGDAYCWGTDFEGTIKTTPTLVGGGLKFHSISVGGLHVLALTSDGTPYGWGSSYNSALGTGTGGILPEKLSTTLKFIELSAGGTSSAGLTADGSVYVWGTGVLGIDFAGYDGGTQTIKTPTKLADGYGPFRTVSVGSAGTAAIDRKGGLWWWGSYSLDGGSLDQCVGTSTNCGVWLTARTPRSFGASVTSVSAGSNHAVALSATGVMMAWGGNSGGQLGRGDTSYATTPTSLEASYSIALSSPIWIEPGKTVTLPITVTRRGGFNINGVGFPGDISLAISGTLPTGVTATITPSTLGPDATTATITITASSGAAPGVIGLNLDAKAPGMPDQSAPLNAVIPKPIPAEGLNLVCSPANFTEYDYFGFYCMNANGVLAPGKYDIKPLHTPVGGSVWWVESNSEVCVQWDANNGNTRVRYSGGISNEPTQVDGRWGILVKHDGTPEIRPGNTWFLYTSAMDPQLQALSYIPTFTSGQSPVLNYNFQKKTGCPW